MRKKIGYTFVAYILIFSSFAALLSTTVQLFFEYRRDIGYIEATVDQIRRGHRATIVQALWAYDRTILHTQLQGVLNLPDVSYACVRKDDDIILEAGPATAPEKSRTFDIPLVHDASGQQIQLGTLTVRLSLSAVYQRLWDRVLVILCTQTLKALLVSTFIFFLFHFVVGRHLKTMASFAQSVRLNNLDRPLGLKRKSRGGNGDELSVVESALNIMRRNLLDETNNLRASQKALAASDARFKSLVANIPGVVYRRGLPPEWTVDYISERVIDLCGYAADEFLSGRVGFARVIHPEDLPRVSDAIDTHVAQGMPFEIEYRVTGRDGAVRHVMEKGAAALDAAGRPQWIDSIILDVTELKTVQRRNRDLEAKLIQAQKMESIGTLAGGIAHDFNNILFPIIGLAELMLDDLPPDSLDAENAQEILEAGMRGANLVKQILAFSRKTEPLLMPVTVQKVLADVLHLTRATIPANIAIELDIQADCGRIMADPTQIHQVALNIITNAYHAVEADGGTIRVRLAETVLEKDDPMVRDRDGGRYVLFSVTDTGSGIAPADLEKIFDPYFTTKPQGKGTGLGLSVVYGIVKNHGGEIRVRSEPGRGTTVDIYFPGVDTACPAHPDAGQPTCPSGTERILLVDDEAAIVRLEKRILDRLGYRTTAFTSSPAALSAFREAPDAFDLVISDMSMPGMTGDRLAREMLAVRADIPIIVCTGYNEKIDPEGATRLGIRGFLMKPVVKARMAAMVRTVLDAAGG